MNILIIIPTYNEAENIAELIKEIISKNPNLSILVIDDNSTDGTYNIVKKLTEKYTGSLYIIQREKKLGLASAYITGIKWGIKNNFDTFCEMDADFSHNPDYLTIMIEKLQTYDVIIGSRNIKNGSVEGWSFIRNFISKGGSLYSRLVLGLPPIYDLTGGFNIWKLSAIEKINIDTIKSEGYLFQIEMKYKAWKRNCKIVEIPILFKNRKYGKSKMSLKIFLEAFVKIWSIRNT